MTLSQGKYNKPNFTPHQKTYVENRLKDERLRAKEEEKYLFWRDVIQLHLKKESIEDNEMNYPDSCWKVARHRLNKDMLHKLVKRSSFWELLHTHRIEYLREQDSNNVVLLKDMRKTCKPLINYSIVLKSKTKAVDTSVEADQSFYKGGLKISLHKAIFNV